MNTKNKPLLRRASHLSGWAADVSGYFSPRASTNVIMTARFTISRNLKDEMAADHTTGTAATKRNRSRASPPSRPTPPRWSNAGTIIRQSIHADAHMDEYSPRPPRRTSTNKLCVSGQRRLRQLHDSAARSRTSSVHRARGCKDGVLNETTTRAREGGRWKSAYWKPAMKQVSEVRPGRFGPNLCARTVVCSHQLVDVCARTMRYYLRTTFKCSLRARSVYFGAVRNAERLTR